MLRKWWYFLKYPFKLWAYEMIDQWVMHFPSSRKEKKVLIFRLDLIGDYFMCRPFFSALKKDERWEGYSFTFAGNQQVKSLAESLDKDVFEEFIWIDRARFINSWGYRFQVLKKIRQSGFEMVLYPSHTRQFWLESVVRVSGAAQKWTSKGVGHYMSSLEKNLSDPKYTGHLETGGPVLFEFYRNRNFFSHFSSSVFNVKTLQSTPSAWSQSRNQSGAGLIVIAPGASTKNRQWPLSFFSTLLSELDQIGKFEFVVLGGPSEKEAGEWLVSNLPEIKIQNLAGQMSLLQSFEFIQTANLLISNESGPVHMAATTGTPCICISQGNHFGRWNPYPSEVAPEIETVYPPSFGDVEHRYEALSEAYHEGSDVNISEIPVEKVFATARILLQKQGF